MKAKKDTAVLYFTQRHERELMREERPTDTDRKLVVDIDEIERLGIPKRCALFWSYLRMRCAESSDGSAAFSRREAARWNLTDYNAIGQVRNILEDEGLIEVESHRGRSACCKYRLKVEIDEDGRAYRAAPKEGCEKHGR